MKIKKLLSKICLLMLLGTMSLSIFSSCGMENNKNGSSESDGKLGEFEMEGKFILDKREPEFIKCDGANIPIPDPHIFIAEDGNYYLYGTGVNFAYTSPDLKNWEKTGPIYSEQPYVYTGNEKLDKEKHKIFNFWSPDVYRINGKYYLFVTGPVSEQQPTDYAGSQLDISTFVSEADSPLGPFDKFVTIKPRVENIKAPHSIIGDDPTEVKYKKGYEYYNTIRVDFHLFEDDDGKTYFTYTGYGNKNDKTEAGNHIVFTELKNPEFIGNGDNPGFYYDFIEDTYVHASNPLDWPEFEGVIPTCLDHFGNVWKPFGGFPRGVTEAPHLAKQNGWYQLYFSCNTWDSPEYQIVCVMVKNLKNYDVDVRKTLSEDEIKFGRFAIPKKVGKVWANYGSGGIFRDKEGKLIYSYHITYPTCNRDVVLKEIIW